MKNFVHKYKSFRPFTDAEAWFLFKLAAIAEACGWTLLITGILLKRFVFSGNNLPVEITGQIHGTLFLIYITAVVIVSPSLKWGGRRSIIAGLCSVPPYGSLLFELWAAHERNKSSFKNLNYLICYRLLVAKPKLLTDSP